MNDALATIKRRERRRGARLQLQLAQIVVFNDPDFFFSSPVEKAQTPGERERGTERCLLPGGYDNQIGIRLMLEAVIDIEPFRIYRYRRK